MSTVFVSYANQHRDLVDQLSQRLNPLGISTWADWRSIAPGQDWVTAIERGIKECDLFVLLVTREAVVSSWIDRELHSAMAHDRTIFPVICNGTEPSDRMSFFVRGTQSATFDGTTTSLDAVARSIADWFGLAAPTAPRSSSSSSVEAPSLPDPFDQKITESRPAVFILLVDCSHSMSQRLRGTASTSKREAVADTVNRFLYRLLEAAIRPRGYRDLFYVAVLGYGSGTNGLGVSSLLPFDEELVAVSRLVGTWREVVDREVHVGGESKRINEPRWVRPTSFVQGHTVMRTAFVRAQELVDEWIVQHPDAVPPIVLNLTDGDWTGDDPRDAARALQETVTDTGATVVFNCQLAGAAPDTERLLFPAELPDRVPLHTRELFYLSSILPESMRAEGLRRNHQIESGGRGLAVNVALDDLVDFLSIGTRTTL